MTDYVKKRVLELFGEGKLYCAETALKVIAEVGGKDSNDLIRLATGFCSGESRSCGQCGAVSGAIMGIGLFSGRHEPGGEYEACYAITQEFMEQFKAKYKSVNCFELIGCDFATKEGQEKFKKEGLIKRCEVYTINAVDIALSLLREHGYLPSHEEYIKSRLAPCGLSCGKCLAYAGGPIQGLSAHLAEELGDNFGVYAERFEGMNPVFKNYTAFRELLDFFTEGSCSGCREKGCLFKDCKVTGCVKEKGIDYCFQCDEFPCDRHGMPDGLAERWQANNEKMRDIGIDAWFCGCKDNPRYP